jgi:cation diffusion facilitator CzcD-associated flavoprotein CzcO
VDKAQLVDGAAEFDVVVVGAGLAGLNALYRIREEGHRVVCLEASEEVGGTWNMNRYPGARVDVESLEYSFCFHEDLQQEWRWPLTYSEQPDVLRYMVWASERLDLRRDIRFNTRVATARWDEGRALWILTDQDENDVTARHCVMATGFLSAPYLPDLPGLSEFEGEVVHAGDWPREGVEFAGRRVGVVGAGATGVQIVPTIAPEVAELAVFMRTPNWCLPIQNGPIAPEDERRVKARYPELRQRESELPNGVALAQSKPVEVEERAAFDVSDEEREAGYERRWALGGLQVMSTWSDIRTDLQANATLCDFLERKIRARVDDPDVADLLVPDYPIGSRRPCGETDFYEAFNRDNVALVSTRHDPIVRFTGRTVRLESGASIELDVLVFATGFDAGSGAFSRMEIIGRDGRTMADHWRDGIRSSVGVMADGFPNFYWVDGAHGLGAFFSPPLLTDYQVKYVLRLIAHADSLAATAEPTREAEDRWLKSLEEAVQKTLVRFSTSWWVGGNVKGKKRSAINYPGGFPEYKRLCELAADDDFQGYRLTPVHAGALRAG